MGSPSNYQLASEHVAARNGTYDTPERRLAAAQVFALLSVCDHLLDLQQSFDRLAGQMESLPGDVRGVGEAIGTQGNFMLAQVRAATDAVTQAVHSSR